MILLSIDPGFERLGLAILEKEGRGKETLLYSECFKTSSKLPHHERLRLIGNKIKDIIEEYKPTVLATEKLFFTSNQKTVIPVAEARGVILFIAGSHNLSVFEYSPPEIKLAVTGHGHSDKKQIMTMIPRLIVIKKDIKSDDEFDAIAIGLTHYAIFRS
ncbi:MAG: crossover junction endodeoxyribonuclease RuvC [Minisyncoccota bacterium]